MFAKLRSGDISLKHEQRSGRPVKAVESHIKAIFDSDRHSTMQMQCIEKKLEQLSYVRKLDFGSPLTRFAVETQEN